MSRELMPKSGIMMPHVVINRDAAVVGVSTVDGVAGAVNLTDKYLQKTDAADTYLTKTDGATKTFVTDAIGPIMSGALFKDDPVVANDVAFRSGGANGVESVDMIKVTPENTIKLGSYASSVQGVEVHSAGRLQVVDQNDSGVETKYPVYSTRYRPEIEDLPFAAIGSYVKDSKGRTVGVTRTGINSDIKQLTQKVTFQQPVTVSDAVNDSDAPTWRQVQNLVDSGTILRTSDVGTMGDKIPRLDGLNVWPSEQKFQQRIYQVTYPPSNPSTGDYINSLGFRTNILGLGARDDPQGGYASFYYQDNVNIKVSAVINLNAYGIDRNWVFEQSGNAIAPGSWVTNSDDRIKTNKERIQNPLSLMKEIGGYTWTRLDGGAWGIGFIAQEVAKIFPEAVQETGDRTLDDGTVVKGVLSPDTYGVAAALHHEAILALMEQVEQLKAEVAELKSSK